MSSNQRWCVAYSGDRRTVKPIAVSCDTLLRYFGSKADFDLLLIGEKWTKADRDLVGSVVGRSDRQVQFHYMECEVASYEGLPNFRGSTACYVPLNLPDYFDANRFLYLDFDTLPRIDVSPLFERDLDENACAAVCWSNTFEASQEAVFFQKLGFQGATPALNSGVMLIDAENWKQQNLSGQMLQFARKHCSDILSDQTVLNAVIKGQFDQLPWRYNVRLGSNAALFDGEGVMHFVGSPKPWSSMGRYRHGNYLNWKRHLELYIRS